MAKTLTLRLDDNDEKLLEELRLFTGEKTDSKSLMKAAFLALKLRDENYDLKTMIEVRNEKIKTQNQVIESAREAGLALYEATAQADLLDD